MWHIEFTAAAAKQFAKLGQTAQREISHYLDRLLDAENPTDYGKPLLGELSGFWRYRVGKYRLIAEIQEQRFIIEIIRIGKRDTVYRDTVYRD